MPLFDGRTPLDVYHDFIAAFSDTFQHMFGMPPARYVPSAELSVKYQLHPMLHLQQPPHSKMPP